jgi:serine/threonine-protein kinase
MSSATKTGALMGTPYYMSPEQTVGAKGVDHRTDLWALGVVAFECVTGQRPFEAETVGGLAVAICSGPMPAPSRVNQALPPEVDRWFARACAREVSLRFGSAKEMADELHVLAAGQRSNPRFATDARGLPHAATEMAPPLPPSANVPAGPSVEPAPTAGVTTQAPVSGEAQEPVTLKRGNKGLALGVAAVVVLAGAAAVWLKLANPSPVQPSVASTQAVQPPPPTPLPSAATAAALSPAPVVAPPVAPSADRKVPASGATTVKQGASPMVAPPGPKSAGKSTPPAAPSRAPNCDPNYTLDANGEQHFKPECFAH